MVSELETHDDKLISTLEVTNENMTKKHKILRSIRLWIIFWSVAAWVLV